jgi:hypothetical protein
LLVNSMGNLNYFVLHKSMASYFSGCSVMAERGPQRNLLCTFTSYKRVTS